MLADTVGDSSPRRCSIAGAGSGRDPDGPAEAQNGRCLVKDIMSNLMMNFNKINNLRTADCVLSADYLWTTQDIVVLLWRARAS